MIWRLVELCRAYCCRSPEIHIIAIEHFKFLEGDPGSVPRGNAVMAGSSAWLQWPVARAAIVRGLAVLFDSPAGELARKADFSRAYAPGVFGGSEVYVRPGPPLDEYYDLGDPLGLQRMKRQVPSMQRRRKSPAR